MDLPIYYNEKLTSEFLVIGNSSQAEVGEYYQKKTKKTS